MFLWQIVDFLLYQTAKSILLFFSLYNLKITNKNEAQRIYSLENFMKDLKETHTHIGISNFRTSYKQLNFLKNEQEREKQKVEQETSLGLQAWPWQCRFSKKTNCTLKWIELNEVPFFERANVYEYNKQNSGNFVYFIQHY